MDILFATHNKSKKKIYVEGLKSKNINVLTLDDLEICLDVEEDGKTSKENAVKKAKEYNKISKMITVSVDDSLVIENIPSNIQPGVNVRRVNGKVLNDIEMIEYYSNLVKKYGDNGKLNACFEKSIAICFNQNEVYSYDYKNKIILTDKVSDIINPGYPISSISIVPEFNKYAASLTTFEKEEINNIRYKKAFQFIKEKLKERLENE